MSKQKFDAVTLEIVWTRLISLVDEAAKALARTAFSTLSNEANDFACVLTDRRGYLISQNSGSIPSFIATLPATVKHFIAEFGLDSLNEGDVLSTNDPWLGTGHLNDICVVKPIFRHGKVVAFAASTSHVPDIGGRIRSVEPREVFEEGFYIPPLKIIDRGVPDKTFFALLRAAVRTPEQTVGDIYAQITAIDLIERRLGELMGDYDYADLDDLADELNMRCEQAMRSAIAAIPNGAYTHEMTTDGLSAEAPFKLVVSVVVENDRIIIDWTGSSPVQPRSINTPYCYTYAMSCYAIKCALLADLANNEGVFRAIEVVAPKDCIVNPQFPAAVGGRSNTGHYLPSVIFGALASILPDRVMAAAGSPLWNMTQAGTRDGKPYANNLFFNGGMGATLSKDGESSMSWPSNISSTPVEIAEKNTPFFIQYKRLREGSGGDGKTRGGLGQDVLLVSESETPVTVVFLAERTRFPAPGLDGADAGGCGAVIINGEAVDSRRQYVLAKGDTVLLRTPGGGGYGSPQERDAERRAQDRLDGYAE